MINLQNSINIDEMIINWHCPEPMLCNVATTGMSEFQRENTCYRCWLNFCKIHNIQINYGEDNYE